MCYVLRGTETNHIFTIKRKMHRSVVNTTIVFKYMRKAEIMRTMIQSTEEPPTQFVIEKIDIDDLKKTIVPFTLIE